MPELKIVRRISATPKTVFEAMTSAAGMASWWGPDDGPVLISESDPRVGGHYRVRFKMLDGSEHEVRGQFLEFDSPHRAVMSFRWLGDEDDRGLSRLEITLRQVGAETELTFVHANLHSEKTRESHEQGWNGSLNKLERLLAREGK